MIAQYIAAGILDLIALTVLAVAVACWIQRARERRAQRRYVAWRSAQRRQVTTPAPAPKPVIHRDADEAYGAELARAGQAAVSADLRTTGEQMAVDHDELNAISAALDVFGHNVEEAINRFLHDDPRERLRVARWSTDTCEDTTPFTLSPVGGS
jgi:hypothetical protein